MSSCNPFDLDDAMKTFKDKLIKANYYSGYKYVDLDVNILDDFVNKYLDRLDYNTQQKRFFNENRFIESLYSDYIIWKVCDVTVPTGKKIYYFVEMNDLDFHEKGLHDKVWINENYKCVTDGVYFIIPKPEFISFE